MSIIELLMNTHAILIITILSFLSLICFLAIKRRINDCQSLRISRWKQYKGLKQHDIMNMKEKKYSYEALRGKKCLVTGGCGFLGGHIVEKLLEQNCYVTIFDLATSSPHSRAKLITGNITKFEQVEKACQGIEIVFHCATANPLSQNKKLLHDVNVKGTENLLLASRRASVKRFIFTSSASVVFDGKDQQNADESCPFPKTFRDTYSQTKALAEQLVLQNNGIDGLLTIALRPHGIFGPNDLHFFPTLVENAIKGKTKFQIGDGSNVADFTYVGNVVHGHLLAAEQLIETSKCGGKAYFLTNAEPLPFWEMLSMVLVGLGYQPPYIALPYSVCYYGAKVLEIILSFLNCFIKTPIPTFTPSKVQLAGLHHFYSCKKAMNELNYKPLWTLNEGLNLSLKSFSYLSKKEKTQDKTRKQKDQSINKYTKEQVAQHKTRENAWIIVNKRVYDISEYVDDHPGGDSILNDVGGDATKGFNGDQHPPTVKDHIEEYYIGDLIDS